MVRSPQHRPMVVIRFTMPDGSMLERSWSLADLDAGSKPPDLSTIPPWLASPMRTWTHPQDPITYMGTVKPGYEDAARELVGVER